MIEKTKYVILGLLLLASVSFADWDGSSSEPDSTWIDGKVFYEISTAEELAWFAEQVNDGRDSINAVLVDDIKFMDNIGKTNSVNWMPIGKDSSSMFNGIFDGAGRTIYGIYCSRGTFAGIFGVTNKKAIIKNVKSAKSLIEVSAIFSYAGGFVAYNGGIVAGCENAGLISSDYKYSYLGGIVGWNVGLVTDCKNLGRQIVSVKYSPGSWVYAGGLVGGDSSFAKITNSFNVGDSCCFGVVSRYDPGLVINSFFDSDVLPSSIGVPNNIGQHTSDMQNDRFAWVLNTTNGTAINSEIWSRDSVGYPIFADSSHKPIYKIAFEDSNVITNRYTNYKGIVDLPANPKALVGKIFFSWFTEDDIKVEPTTVFTKDQTVHAVYTDAADVYFSIRFFNSDTTLLDSQYVPCGKVPSFSGTPTRVSSAQYDYTFVGWNVEPYAASENFDYYAVYSETTRFYTVRFLDYEGSELQKSSFLYGVTPKISKTPTRVSTAVYNYTFAGWSPEIEKVAGPAIYTALYDSSLVSQGDISSSSSSNAKPSSSESSFSSSSAKYSSSSVSQYSSSSLESPDAIVINFSATEWKISVSGRNFLIYAAPIGEVYSLFDMQGKVLAKGRVEKSEMMITTPHAGSYIIRVGESSVRVNVK